jgi:hypothetical protein
MSQLPAQQNFNGGMNNQGYPQLQQQFSQQQFSQQQQQQFSQQQQQLPITQSVPMSNGQRPSGNHGMHSSQYAPQNQAFLPNSLPSSSSSHANVHPNALPMQTPDHSNGMQRQPSFQEQQPRLHVNTHLSATSREPSSGSLHPQLSIQTSTPLAQGQSIAQNPSFNFQQRVWGLCVWTM